MREPTAPIVVAYNWSSGARMALAWALREGAYRRRPVRVLFVVEPGNPLAPDPTEARRQLALVLAEATNLGRVNVNTSGDVLEGSLADHLMRESRTADLLVVGAGAAGRYKDAAWVQIWTRIVCPVAIVRGRARVPDRRPVLLAVAEHSQAGTRTNNEATHEADLRDVGLFAVLPGPPEVAESRVCRTQLVVADLPRQLAGQTVDCDSTLRWVLDQTTQCPVLLVPALDVA
jgi:nucleotide-binding universal stress UspA family protein